MAAPADDELMRLFQEGDSSALDSLFTRHATSVYNLARLILSNAAEAEDVLQETFLAVIRAARSYDGRGRFRPWLLRIARNRCLNRAETRRLVSTEEVAPAASADPDPPQILEMDEQMRGVHAAIARLPVRQREALALYAFDDLSYRQIARVMEAPIGTVKTLIHRARVTLARELGEGGGAGQ